MSTNIVKTSRSLFTTILLATSIFLYFADISQAASTSELLPSSDGTYAAWTPSAGATHYTLVDEIGCNGVTDYVSTATAGNRDSYGINLSSIPNGSTITKISVTPCASRNAGGGGGSATLNVFYRFAGIDSADAGAYALTGTTPAGLSTTNFSSLSLAKVSTSTLEIGAVYTSGTKGARVSRLATVITYTPPTATVTTNAATSVGTSTATLNGTANPNGTAATGWFRYSTTNPGSCSDSFGTRVPLSGGTALGSGTSDVNYSNNLTALAASTTYYYCAIAATGGGTTTGSVQSFVTSALPLPTVTTNAATLIASSSATLNGTGNPNGYSATGWFRYSTTNPGTCDDAFGTRAPAAGGTALGSGSVGVNYSRALTGLAANTTYYACAIASSTAGTGVGSVVSFTTNPSTAPDAPTGASVTNVSGTQNDVSWTDNASTEAGYKVERSTNGGAYTQIATTSANATSYSDTAATADQTYVYRVRAYNVVGNSGYSTTGSVITATVVPADPSSLGSLVGTSTPADVFLFWSHTGNNEAGFKVYRSDDNVNFTEVTSTAANFTSAQNTPGTSGTYYYKVTAYNSIGESGYSNTETVVVP